MNAPGERAAARAAIVLPCIGALVLLAYGLVTHYSIVDDAYISYRYVDNWLAGDGLAYNAGERVEGYTSLLWIVLLAPLRLVGVPPVIASTGLLGCALAVLLWAVYRTATDLAGDTRAGWAAFILAAGSPMLARWTVSGMETVCYAALLAVAMQRLAARRAHGIGSSIAFGLAVLARPPGAMHAVIAFAAALPWLGSERPRRVLALVGPGLVFAALPVAQVLFRLAYYGAPLPNTYYAKLTGDLPPLWPWGLGYVLRFLVSGGAVLVLCAGLAAFVGRRGEWVLAALAVQVVAQIAYTVRVGGDYFAFHRFVVPVLPALAILGGVGLHAVAGRAGQRLAAAVPAAAVILAALQTGLAYASYEQFTHDLAVESRAEREAIAAWLQANYPSDATIAVNTAGVIPYRTRMPTIDMLGLNDRHIALSPSKYTRDGMSGIGHLKHDGAYVCDRAPDLVLTSGGTLHRGRSMEEAIMQAALNTFPGDREFLRAPECSVRYMPVAEELRPGQFVVVYVRQAGPVPPDEPRSGVASAEEWFGRGIKRMRGAKFVEAIAAFEQSLALRPGNPAAMSNVGFCLLDLQRYREAIAVFDRVLSSRPDHLDALYGLALAHENLHHDDEALRYWRAYIATAPDSPWRERALRHLALLQDTSL